MFEELPQPAAVTPANPHAGNRSGESVIRNVVAVAVGRVVVKEADEGTGAGADDGLHHRLEIRSEGQDLLTVDERIARVDDSSVRHSFEIGRIRDDVRRAEAQQAYLGQRGSPGNPLGVGRIERREFELERVGGRGVRQRETLEMEVRFDATGS